MLITCSRPTCENAVADREPAIAARKWNSLVRGEIA
jgi:hypothetical protein